MVLLRLFTQYFAWHYSQAIKDLWMVWMNILWFLSHFFSIKLMLKTLVAPWRRMAESRKSGFDIEAFFETLVVNTIMRLIGFVMRTVLIVVGIVIWSVAAVGGVVAIVAWLLAPVIVIGLFYAGWVFISAPV